METKQKQLALFIIGVVLYNWFFWKEELGLNSLLFNIVIIGSSMVVYPRAIKSNGFRLMALTSLITSLMIFFYGSTIAKTINFVSLIIFIGYTHQPNLNAIFFAGLTSIVNFFRIPLKHVFTTFRKKDTNNNVLISSLKKIKLVALPIVFLLIFYWIFKIANPKFMVLTNQFWSQVSVYFKWLFLDISWLRIPFFVLGCIIISAFIYHDNIVIFLEKEKDLRNFISRKRNKKVEANHNQFASYHFKNKSLSIRLKNEYQSALILVGAINLLLVLVNSLDVSWLWFNFQYNGDFSLSQFVHEGTYLLILSVLLSMGIIFYFFRKNINFFPSNKLLKYLSVFWIVQNIILVISVGLRNYYYIQYFGLAYKRIGVVVFLLLTLVGLITLILKITKLKSTFYILKINSISVLASFVLLCFFNWDVLICKYNLSHVNESKVDIEFLLSLSDKALPFIDQNRSALNAENLTYYGQSFELILSDRIRLFKEKQAKLSWLSMNLSTQNAIDYFNNKNKGDE